MTKKKQKKLGKLAMRVAVAKDVIAQVRLNRMQMIYGSYLVSDQLTTRLGLFQNGQDKTPKVIQQCFVNTKSCQVCAKGALFMAYVRRFDSVSQDEVERMAGGQSDTLSKIFGPLWDAIEQLYEEVIFLPGIPSKADNRITWLMKNIIASGGRSVYPPKK